MSFPISRRLLMAVAALVAASDASAQARGSVTISAHVLPSAILLSRNLPPSEATGHTVMASAEFGAITAPVVAGSAEKSARAVSRPEISMIGRPREVARIGDQVEMIVTIVVQSNVSYRILAEATSVNAASSTMAGLQVHDASGQFHSLSNNGPVVAVEAAAAGSNRQAEIRYRVNSAAAAGQTVLPLRLTLQTSAML